MAAGRPDPRQVMRAAVTSASRPANNDGVAKKTGISHARALEIQEDLHAWMCSARTSEFFLAEAIDDYLEQGLDVETVFANRDKMEEAEEMRRGLEIHYLEGWVPTFCTKEFGLMAVTMARSAPRDAMIESDLPDIAGLLVFEEPITLEARAAADDPGKPGTGLAFGRPGGRVARGFVDRPVNDEVEMVRALTWFTWKDTRPDGPTSWLCARVWTEKQPPNTVGRFPVEGKVRLYSGGKVSSPITGSREAHADWAAVRLLRSAFALMASPMTGSDEEPRNVKTHPRTKRSTAADSIRRVYLRHPEHAHYEAEEELAAREGRAQVRLHWVRGFWRHQWYPSEHNHHWIWIEGFPRGHIEAGIVDSPKIQIARE